MKGRAGRFSIRILPALSGGAWREYDMAMYVPLLPMRIGLHFFADAVFAYENAKKHTLYTHTNGWGVGLCLGVLIDLTRHLQLLARTTFVQYAEAGKKPY